MKEHLNISVDDKQRKKEKEEKLKKVLLSINLNL